MAKNIIKTQPNSWSKREEYNRIELFLSQDILEFLVPFLSFRLHGLTTVKGSRKSVFKTFLATERFWIILKLKFCPFI